VASQITEAALFGLFRPYILAKFTLGALVKPLFRQFHREVRRIPLLGTSVNKPNVHLAPHLQQLTATELRLYEILGSSSEP
jgi:hypothetical protein